MENSTFREGLAQFYGKGRFPFFARFRRYSAEAIGEGWRALLIHVMDENLHIVADHAWVTLPKFKDLPAWALPIRTPLKLEASVSMYERKTGELDYCLSPIHTAEVLKLFPVETPALLQDHEKELEKLISDKEYREYWIGAPSVTCLPRRVKKEHLLF